MKNVKIICIILIFSLLFCTIISGKVFAKAYTSSQMLTRVQDMAGGNPEDKSGIVESTNSIAGAIITIARVIATGVAVIMIIVLAMKYMMAAPGDRADIKKHAVVYIVGAVVMFACSGILAIIQKFATNIG